MELIGVLAFFVFLIWAIIHWNEDQVELYKLNKEKILNFIKNKNITANNFFISNDQKIFLALDEIHKVILIGALENGNIKSSHIEYDKILSVEIIKNGKGIVSSNEANNRISSAITGAVLLGGVGAIVGAIAGGVNDLKCIEYGLRLILDDINNPVVKINFLNGQEVPKNSEVYKDTESKIENWYSKLYIIVHRNKKYK